MIENNKTCGNCFFSNTVELFDPVCASMGAVHKFKEDTGIDLIRTVQTKCHYGGAPQVVDAKLDWCHQWKSKDTY